MTFKAILEGTIRRDAENWVRQLMKKNGYKVRLVNAEQIVYLGKNEQAECHVEVWYGEHDQAGVKVVYSLDDTDGAEHMSILNDKRTRHIWFDSKGMREYNNIDKFELTRREF